MDQLNYSKYKRIITIVFLGILLLIPGYHVFAQDNKGFKVIAFYSGKNDPAHVSFVNEANAWFAEKASEQDFSYESTDDWNKMTPGFLAGFDVVVFLDTRPDSLPQREAFQHYMENDGAWLGFHFCAFALTPSAYPQNWYWYHNHFLGSGQYRGNTWRPTRAVLQVETKNHPATQNLPETFVASPNEWYRWEHDLRENPDIEILASIHPSSFPLGTGPKPHEIWHEGYFPVVWTNKNYRMIYINMGHNDIDYESGTNRELSFTFKNNTQNTLVLDALLGLGKHSGSR